MGEPMQETKTAFKITSFKKHFVSVISHYSLK
jgi:hypothetical protein